MDKFRQEFRCRCDERHKLTKRILIEEAKVGRSALGYSTMVNFLIGGSYLRRKLRKRRAVKRMRQRGDLIEVIRSKFHCSNCGHENSVTFLLTDDGKMMLEGRFDDVHQEVHSTEIHRHFSELLGIFEKMPDFMDDEEQWTREFYARATEQRVEGHRRECGIM